MVSDCYAGDWLGTTGGVGNNLSRYATGMMMVIMPMETSSEVGKVIQMGQVISQLHPTGLNYWSYVKEYYHSRYHCNHESVAVAGDMIFKSSSSFLPSLVCFPVLWQRVLLSVLSRETTESAPVHRAVARRVVLPWQSRDTGSSL